jgi:undecaprenyl diphosphate synthase
MDKNTKTIIPGHVGIIMDGNRRWAKERNLPAYEGHLKGYNKLKIVPEWFFARGVKILSVFAFSAENWDRSRDEVNYLMKLIKQALKDDLEDFNRRGYKLALSGRIEELPGDLPEICHEAAIKTKDNDRGILNICVNYGGRAEIVDVIKKMMQKQIDIGQVHEGMVRKYLYHGELCDPDIIIRTSGEERLSGFQLWQSADAELLFLKKYWPDFEKTDVDIILDEYDNRKKRFSGGAGQQK